MERLIIKADTKVRLDTFISDNSEISRSAAQKIIKSGNVYVVPEEVDIYAEIGIDNDSDDSGRRGYSLQQKMKKNFQNML